MLITGKVNLFTRPRRFGKTLNLSMLRYFFEDTGDVKKNEENQSLFQGLKIMEQGEEYTQHMGNYPVINLTLKSAKQPTFESAYGKMKRAIADEFQRHQYILPNEKITEEDKKLFLNGQVRSIKAIIILEKTYMKGKFFGKFLIAQDLDLK